MWQPPPNIHEHYLLWVFLSGIGVLQMAAARSGMRHFLLLRTRRAAALLGAFLLVGGYCYFFSVAAYGERGLEGAQLFSLFGIAVITAFITCVGLRVLRSGRVAQARESLDSRVRAALAELFPPAGRAKDGRT